MRYLAFLFVFLCAAIPFRNSIADQPGSRCTELVCLTDVIATVADLLDVELSENAAEDGFSFLSAMKGQPGHARDHVIHHSNLGYFAIRQGNWKLACCPGSGG